VTVFGDGGDPGSSFAGVVIGHSAYGSYKITGGELNLNTGNSIWPFLFVGLFAPGVYDQSGGTVISPRAENTMLGYMGDAPAVMNITGGLYQESHISVGNGIVVGCGSSFTGRATGGTATLNIGGGPALATVDITTGAVSGFVALGLGDTGTGIVNLGTNGVLKPGCVTGGGFIGQKGTGIFNFHGGTLNLGAVSLPSGATTAMEGLDHAYVYSEGAIIDTNGMDSTIAQNLESPSDSGIKKIDVGSGGSGYLGAPVVAISGGTGSGATAVAVMNGDKIDHFAITNPGSGYNSNDVLTVTLSGGGYATAATASIGTGANYFAANVGGGLKKLGGGDLTLTGTLTYAGDTTVNEGTLNITDLSTPSATVTVKDGAVLNAVSITADTLTIGGVPETSAVAVPEPDTLALLAIAVLGGIGMAWRKRK
jgi:autotransporter-associated beta strand protein